MSALDRLFREAEDKYNDGYSDTSLQILASIDNGLLSINSYLKRAEMYTKLKELDKAEEDLNSALLVVKKDNLGKSSQMISILMKRLTIRESQEKYSQALEDIDYLYDITKDNSLLQSKQRLLRLEKDVKLKTEAGNFLMILKENLETKPGSEWHVVSMSWFEKWQIYVKISSFYMEEEIPFKVSRSLYHSDAPGIIDNSNIIDYEKTGIVIEDPNNPYNKICLKKGMAENMDFILLPAPAYEFLYNIYGCNTDIKRYAIEINDTMYQVEVMLRMISIATSVKESIDTVVMNVSSKQTIEKMKKSFLNIKKIPGQAKVWKINLTMISLDKLQALISTNETVFLDGAKILQENLLIDDAEISEQDLIFIELPKKSVFLFTDDSKKISDRCGFCQSSVKLTIVCLKCKKMKYCSVVCQTNHLIDHKTHCKPPRRGLLRCFCKNSLTDHSEDEAQVVPVETIIKHKSGLTGLQNLGNTCFMNSALQCLSHTNEITEVLLSGRYLELLNKNNPLGTNGKLVLSYAELLQNLWKGNNSSFAPWKLKRIISNYAPQFVGYQQHDSQELLGFILDRIHEDLNQVKKKPYFEDNDIIGKNDEELSRESWRRHSLRNQSIIVDLMHGQYKSSLLCPLCKKYSYTFDPFNSITLPLPQSQEKILSFYYIFYESTKAPYSMAIEYSSGDTLEHVSSEISKLLEISQESFIYATILNDIIKEFPQKKKSIEPLRNFTLFAYEIKEEKNLEIIELQVGIEKNKSRNSSYSRILCVPQNFTFKELHWEIFLKFKNNFPRMNFKQRTQELYEDFMTSPAYIVYFLPYKDVPCNFCKDDNCKGCPIPYSNEKIRKIFTEGRVILELLWRANHQLLGASLNDLNRCTEHSCVIEVTQKSRKNPVKIEECFELFRVPEQLEKDNAWYCNNCKTHVQAIKKLEIYKVPPVLIIHIKRFKVNGHTKEKLYNPVIFPDQGLDIRDWVIGDNNVKLYDLYAVCNHYGNLTGGHYTATCYSALNKQWFDFKDSQVVVNRDFGNSASAYVLFYRARK
ncbi:hypothetical protein SteCoe_17996 [Stentor coeruleus]|uniref:ubiquitinyl hydrolase 1 n=1 Tax=Stentor coeruleus TaxID=5963 RepID=A0A1R2BXK1_9CILI|nr:hypothetical protein SteCoe_17996 [Stentor coeruleus]